jgi:hypothetical protein
MSRHKLDPCVLLFFNSASALELNPDISTLTPGTHCVTCTVETTSINDLRTKPIVLTSLLAVQ